MTFVICLNNSIIIWLEILPRVGHEVLYSLTKFSMNMVMYTLGKHKKETLKKSFVRLCLQ